MTDEVTPEDRSRLRHQRDDARYVRRVDPDVPTGEADAPDPSRTDPAARPASAAGDHAARRIHTAAVPVASPPEHYVRRVGTPVSLDEAVEPDPDERPELRTTRKPRTGSYPGSLPAGAKPSTSSRTKPTSGRDGSTGTPPRRAGLILTATVLVLILGVGAVAWFSIARGAGHPYGGRPLWTNPDSSAALALEAGAAEAERDAAAILAEQPTGIWLTPEKLPAGAVGQRVREITSLSQSALPIFVVYGITDRDCGGQSAGGLQPAAYLDWVDEIAAAMGNSPSIVVLEPDAIALSVECPDPDGRLQLVSQAVDVFASTRATVYLDGGHSNWLPADEMAGLLRQAGVERVRGFATNVSNTQSTAAEQRYAETLSTALGGAHAVIDTSRNGNGPPAGADWCNVPGRAIGEQPTVLDDPVVDALLWVKPPGESDGHCNGGPAAGDWWPEAAIGLTGTG